MTEVLSITQDYIKNHVTPRDQNSKKGDNGIVLVIGGSTLYHGAPLLASLSALRAGADLVYTAVPKIIVNAIRSYSPNVIALPMTDSSLIIGKGGQDVGAVSSYILPILGVVTIVTTFVTPYILKLGTKLNISSNTSEEKK